jgi:hypothetical protein
LLEGRDFWLKVTFKYPISNIQHDRGEETLYYFQSMVQSSISGRRPFALILDFLLRATFMVQSGRMTGVDNRWMEGWNAVRVQECEGAKNKD